MKAKRGFTLIELLVVVSIIALLVSILIPALSKARAQAKQVVCSANLRALGQAFVLYGSENTDAIPLAYDVRDAPGNHPSWAQKLCWGTLEFDEEGALDLLTCPAGGKDEWYRRIGDGGHYSMNPCLGNNSPADGWDMTLPYCRPRKLSQVSNASGTLVLTEFWYYAYFPNVYKDFSLDTYVPDFNHCKSKGHSVYLHGGYAEELYSLGINSLLLDGHVEMLSLIRYQQPLWPATGVTTIWKNGSWF